MKKILIGLTTLTLMIGLTGCDNFVTPGGVVGTAYEALKQNKLKTFKKALTGDALERFGNPEGMARWQQQLAGLKLRIQDPLLVSTKRMGSGFEQYLLKTYTLDVLAKSASSKESRVLTATVLCENHYIWSSGPAGRSATEVTECKISELN